MLAGLPPTWITPLRVCPSRKSGRRISPGQAGHRYQSSGSVPGECYAGRKAGRTPIPWKAAYGPRRAIPLAMPLSSAAVNRISSPSMIPVHRMVAASEANCGTWTVKNVSRLPSNLPACSAPSPVGYRTLPCRPPPESARFRRTRNGGCFGLFISAIQLPLRSKTGRSSRRKTAGCAGHQGRRDQNPAPPLVARANWSRREARYLSQGAGQQLHVIFKTGVPNLHCLAAAQGRKVLRQLRRRRHRSAADQDRNDGQVTAQRDGYLVMDKVLAAGSFLQILHPARPDDHYRGLAS